MDYKTIISLIRSIQDDGALTREEWVLVLPIVSSLIQKLAQEFHEKPVLYIALCGVQHIIEKTLGELEHAK
jgi:hypothetical protein